MLKLCGDVRWGGGSKWDECGPVYAHDAAVDVEGEKRLRERLLCRGLVRRRGGVRRIILKKVVWICMQSRAL